MKRVCAACFLVVLLCLSSLASATSVVFENLHYGQEALEMHLNNEPNAIVFGGETYSLDDDAVTYEDKLGVYGGKTRAVYEMTVPSNRFSVEDDGQPLLLGEWIINIPHRAELWIAQGNRISGEYELQGPMTLTDVYREQIYLPRDEAGNPLLIDKIYLYRYQVGSSVHCSAATLYIDYENYLAARPVSAASSTAAQVPAPVLPSTAEQTAFPYAAILIAAACVLAVCAACLHLRKKRRRPSVTISSDGEDVIVLGRRMLAQLENEARSIQTEDVRQKAAQLCRLFGQLLDVAQTSPQKSASLRRFVTCYLPVAQKLLTFWLSVSAHDVDESKWQEAHESVTHGLDLIIDACQKQLNHLHSADLMDISTDISALEQVLQREGLKDCGLKLSFDPSVKENEP